MTLAVFIDGNMQKLYGHTSNTERFHINLRCGPVLSIPPVRSTIYGTDSVHFLGPLIWSKLPNLVKSSRSISFY